MSVVVHTNKRKYPVVKVTKKGKVGKRRKSYIPKQPFGHQYWCKMHYNMNLNLAASAGATNGFIFNANSIFDPEQTGVGHQPYFRDTLAAIYNAYVVTHCKMTVLATANTNCILTCRPTTSAAVPINGTLEAERPRCTKAYLTATGNARKLTKSISMHTLFGRTKSAITDEDDFRGVTGNNPSQRGYLAISITNPDTTSTCDIYGTVTMEFTVKWMNLKLLSQS